MQDSKASSFYEQQQYGSHFFLRSEHIDIAAVVQRLLDLQDSKTPPCYVHLYCDSLTYPGDFHQDEAVLDLRPLHRNVVYFHVYARVLFSNLPDLKHFRVLGTHDKIRFRFIYEQSPSGMILSYNRQDVSLELVETVPQTEHLALYLKSQISARTIEREAWEQRCDLLSVSAYAAGCEIVFENPLQPTRSSCDVPLMELHSAKMGRWLPSLLRAIFDMACEKVMRSDTREAVKERISAYQFVVLCLKRSPVHAHLASSARTMLERLRKPFCSPGIKSKATFRFDVPSLATEEYEKNLENNLGALQAVEKDFDKLHDRELILSATFATIDATAELTVQMDQAETLRKNIVSSRREVEIRHIDLEIANKDVRRAATNFDIAIKAYQKKQKAEFNWEFQSQIIGAAGSLAMTIYTGGATAPITLGLVANALEKLERDPKAFDEVSGMKEHWNQKMDEDARAKIAGKVVELGLKLGPQLWAAYQNQDKNCKAAGAIGNGVGNLVTDAGLIESKMSRQELDYLGVMADWEELKICIDAVFEQYKQDLKGDEKVSQLKEYRVALQQLCIRGLKALEAQKQLQRALNEFVDKVTQSADRQNRKKRVEAIKDKLAKSAYVDHRSVEVIRQELATKILDAKRELFLTLHQYCASLTYETGSASFPDIAASSNMDQSTWSTLISQLRKMRTSALGARSPANRFQTTIKTGPGESAFPADWKRLLVSERKLYFSPPLGLVKNRYCIRVETVKITFEGLRRHQNAVVDQNAINCTLELGPALSDRDEEMRLIQYTIGPLRMSFDLDPFSDTPSENKWEMKAIKFNLPALFGPGYIQFSEEMAADLDLKAVKGCTIEFKGDAISGRVK